MTEQQIVAAKPKNAKRLNDNIPLEAFEGTMQKSEEMIRALTVDLKGQA